MRKILLFVAILLLVIACKKEHPAKEGDVYIGRISSNGSYHYDLEKEFTVHILKNFKKPTVYQFRHTDDTSNNYMLIEMNYDKNAKELVGTFNETYTYDWYYPKISGKKIGKDIILAIDGFNGSIYLTPKK